MARPVSATSVTLADPGRTLHGTVGVEAAVDSASSVSSVVFQVRRKGSSEWRTLAAAAAVAAPPSPNTTASLTFWHRLGTWVNDYRGVDPDLLATHMTSNGYDLVIVRVVDPAVPGPAAGVADWIRRVGARGIAVAGWMWGDGSNPAAEAEQAFGTVGLGLAGFVLNGEKAYEGGGRSGAFVRRFRELAGNDFPLGWSPEPQLNLDHAVLQASGVAYLCQAYPYPSPGSVKSAYNGYDVKSCVEVAQRFGYAREAIIPLCGAYPDAAGRRVPAEQFAAELRNAGAPGRVLYPADACQADPAYWTAFAA
jgi:hypothetical protein